MMNMDEVIGDIVLISFRAPDQLLDVGINIKKGHFLVRGYDGYGVWLAHPGLVKVVSEDKNGKPLPSTKQIREEIDATILVTWDNIQTIMHYPDRKGFDFPSEFDKEIGFIPKQKSDD